MAEDTERPMLARQVSEQLLGALTMMGSSAGASLAFSADNSANCLRILQNAAAAAAVRAVGVLGGRPYYCQICLENQPADKVVA